MKKHDGKFFMEWIILTLGSLDWPYGAKSTWILLGGGLSCSLDASNLSKSKTRHTHAQPLHFGIGLLSRVRAGGGS